MTSFEYSKSNFHFNFLFLLSLIGSGTLLWGCGSNPKAESENDSGMDSGSVQREDAHVQPDAHLQPDAPSSGSSCLDPGRWVLQFEQTEGDCAPSTFVPLIANVSEAGITSSAWNCEGCRCAETLDLESCTYELQRDCDLVGVIDRTRCSGAGSDQQITGQCTFEQSAESPSFQCTGSWDFEFAKENCPVLQTLKSGAGLILSQVVPGVSIEFYNADTGPYTLILSRDQLCAGETCIDMDSFRDEQPSILNGHYARFDWPSEFTGATELALYKGRNSTDPEDMRDFSLLGIGNFWK